ncbi:Tex family protein [uncultured Castellaniella sp.]|uniref:Tex family protein n=1 Tax=uncultured Castellaniella sp. TaxID=647907 RepID=UPI002629D78D|nr:Tex family protein [uncultured Castellaniella sp.]
MSTAVAASSSHSVDPARVLRLLCAELDARPAQVAAAVDLLDTGATVPFIARYRKEVTGGLDDTVLRQLEVRLLYIRELEGRRVAILDSIAQQGRLDDALQAQILAADSKQRLEDLYAPYKPKRRTRAQIAREAGLEPLADTLLADRAADPDALAAGYLNADAGFADARAALNGARDILAERFAEQAPLLEALRGELWQTGLIYAQVVAGKETEGEKFRDWFDFHEALRTLPSHRVLALLRGRQQGILDLRLGLDAEREALTPHPCVTRVADLLDIDARFDAQATPRQHWLAEVCRWTWRVKLLTAFETELIGRLREAAETEAIRVFAANLKDLLLAAPAGPKAVLGLDPGIRTGVKVAVIDATGKLLDTATIYPFEPRRDVEGSLRTLAALVQRHRIPLVAIGNGTASRETERLAAVLRERHPELAFDRVVVSEAGASVYSASELGAQEFPDLDVSLRGAVSIARRLQDPLAELVKIEPKAIGVGQYQHDVNQRELAHSLNAVVEDCVNAVGVDVNTASAPLLTRVSGLNASLARNIVQWREEHGAFPNRQALREVPRFGDKAFEQAAGFLRVPGSDNPLDASAVHPEAYPVVEQIVLKAGRSAAELMGQPQALKGLSPADFTSERFGLPTVRDIFAELEKPGRDPRPEFKTAQFKEGIHDIKDLAPGMVLEGVVSNVANFGAFVDIGVHQDGLVHVSALADKFVKDPRDVVRVGQTVQVRVLEVDVARKRIALTMRKDDPEPRHAGRGAEAGNRSGGRPGGRQGRPERPAAAPQGAMAEAFARLQHKR